MVYSFLQSNDQILITQEPMQTPSFMKYEVYSLPFSSQNVIYFLCVYFVFQRLANIVVLKIFSNIFSFYDFITLPSATIINLLNKFMTNDLVAQVKLHKSLRMPWHSNVLQKPKLCQIVIQFHLKFFCMWLWKFQIYLII